MPTEPSRGKEAPAAVERDPVSNAVIDLVLERGYDAVTVDDVLERSGISREEFERRFHTVEDCVLAILDAETERFTGVVFSAYESHETWREGLRAAAYAAAAFVRHNARYIFFSTMMVTSSTERARTRRDLAVQMLVRVVDEGRFEMEDPSAVSPDTAMAVVGSIYEVLQRQLAKGKGAGRAEDFVPELMYLAVRPYLGHAEAMKELSIPPPPPAGSAGEDQ